VRDAALLKEMTDSCVPPVDEILGVQKWIIGRNPCDPLSWLSETAIFMFHRVAKGQACRIVIMCIISYILRRLDYENHR
jgi:hypothetical protein